jgi:hypothetical protein
VKRLPILSKVLMLLICFSFVLAAFNSGSTINGVLLAPYMDTPTVDGADDDAGWPVQEVGMFSLIGDNAPVNAEDLSAWFRLGWNGDGIYLFVHVDDDSIDTSPANSWETDCIEIFIDGLNEDAGSLDANDVQWRAIAMLEGDTLVQCWASGDNLRPNEYELAWNETGTGYEMELAIPEAGLEKLDVPLGIDLSEGTEFGFDLQVTDNDSTKSDDGIRWHAAGGDDYGNPAAWGTVKLDEGDPILEIPMVSFPPNVDGYLDEDWTSDVVPEIGMTVIDGAPANWPDSGSGDFASSFWAAWNTEGFYLFGKVSDDTIYVAEEVTNDNEWQLDCWEVYFDGGNEDAGSYDANDVQYRFVYGHDTATQGPPDGFEIAWAETEIGYNFELTIPAATLTDTGVTLALNQVVGFEVQCADNEGSGREGITKWWNSDGNSYQNSALFGTAKFSSMNEDEIAEEAVSINLSVAPVVTSDAIVSVDVPAGVDAKVSLYNITGQKVDDLAVAGGKATLNAANLPNGVYLCVLKAGDDIISKKISVIK